MGANSNLGASLKWALIRGDRKFKAGLLFEMDANSGCALIGSGY